MIKEEKKELINRKALFQKLAEYMRRSDALGATLESRISVAELLAFITAFPTEDEHYAEWVKGDKDQGWTCSWCTMPVLRDDSGAPVRTKFCSRCGRRMRK